MLIQLITYFIFVAVVALLFYLFIVIINYFNTNQLKWTKFRYTKRNYHLFLLIFVLPLILTAALYSNPIWIAYFLFFGLIGVIGETLFSVIWRLQYTEPFWLYTKETIFRGYSSLLNFIPWGVGGMIYLFFYLLMKEFGGRILTEDWVVLFYFWLVYGTIFTILLISRYIFSKISDNRFLSERISVGNYLSFTLPFLIPLVIFSYIFGISFLIYGLIGGLVAFFCEYKFGKMCKKYLSETLWYYQFIAYKNGHITPLSFIPFMMGAYYYLGAFLILGL